MQIVNNSKSCATEIHRKSTLGAVLHAVAVAGSAIGYEGTVKSVGKDHVIDVDFAIEQVNANFSEMGQACICISVVRALTRIVPFAVKWAGVWIDKALAVDFGEVRFRIQIDVGLWNRLIHLMTVDDHRESIQKNCIVAIDRM